MYNVAAQAKAEAQAVVLTVNLNHAENFATQAEETCQLALAAGFEISDVITANRRHPDRHSFIGKGKVAEIKSCLAFHQAKTLIVNHTLSDGQFARLETELDTELLDYSGLILTIFANRATTLAGKLQVELAQEIYGRSKLKGAWTHLERQRGGLGATGGPGERQLEIDRRLTAAKITKLKKRLAKVNRHVELVTQSRKKSAYTVALVGYTNAGKSTLFAQLTKAEVPASPRLFETLTTTSRQLHLPTPNLSKDIVISDTVGFIHNLPHELVEAFHSTLLEAIQADLLLIVVDASEPDVANKLTTIEATLEQIGAGEIPRILVANKSDRGACQLDLPATKSVKIVDSVKLSALAGSGIDQLNQILLNHYHRTVPVPGTP